MRVTSIFVNKINNIHIQPQPPHAYLHRMPISQKRLAANRANAAKSTGPTSPEGKRISSRNGVSKSLLPKSVLLEGESLPRFNELRDQLEKEFRVETFTEQLLVDSMVVAKWQQFRSWQFYSASINSEIRGQDPGTNATPYERALHAIVASNTPELERMKRDQARYESLFHRSLERLLRFQAEKRNLRGEPSQPQQNEEPRP